MSISKDNLCLRYRSSTAQKTDAFNGMRALVLSCNDYHDVLRVQENTYMEWLTEGKIAAEAAAHKHPDGKWKYATYLDNSYQSAKSVVTQARSLNIEGMGNMGKSQMQKAINAKKKANKEGPCPEATNTLTPQAKMEANFATGIRIGRDAGLEWKEIAEVFQERFNASR